MNVNNFYRELFEYTLGLDVLGLEKQFPQLIKLINRKTILAFSNAIPVIYHYYLDLTNEANIVKKEQHTLGVEYYLSDPVLDKFQMPILSVDSIEYNNIGAVDPYDPDSTAYYNSVITSRQNLTLESVLFGSEYTYNRTLTDSAMPFKRYHELRGSRVLYLKNYAIQGTVEVTMHIAWPNLVSIPEEYHEAFMGLAKLDVKQACWNQLKYLEDVVTPVGNLNLKINDWEGAEKERDEYLQSLRTKSFPDRVGASFFHIL